MEMPVQWSDLLYLVYSKVAGLPNRVRFAAVCRSWRATAVTSRHAAPPVLPWIIFSDACEDGNKRQVYCPEDGQVFRMPVPSQAVGKRFVGAHDGGWVAVLEDGFQLAVLNLFSGVEVLLSANDMRTTGLCGWGDIPKIVFSESPTSSGCILATITHRGSVILCRIACPNNKWIESEFETRLVDILFYNGQLYGLTKFEELVKFQIGMDKGGKLVVTGEPQRLSIRKTDCSIIRLKNIIDLHGKLAMVVRISWSLVEFLSRPLFQVCELVDESTDQYTHRWKEVSLGDYALFLGETWSKVVYVSAAGCDGLQRNCIYSIINPICSTWLGYQGVHSYPPIDDDMWKIRSCVIARAPGGMLVLPPNF